jgi:hypothetical protein
MQQLTPTPTIHGFPCSRAVMAGCASKLPPSHTSPPIPGMTRLKGDEVAHVTNILPSQRSETSTSIPCVEPDSVRQRSAEDSDSTREQKRHDTGQVHPRTCQADRTIIPQMAVPSYSEPLTPTPWCNCEPLGAGGMSSSNVPRTSFKRQS